MPSFILDKTIHVDSPVLSVDSILIDDHFTYVTLYEGIRVQGEIALSGEYQDESESHPFSSTLEVDMMCPNEQICDMQGLKMRVQDFTYTLGEQCIIFHVKCVLEGSEITKENYALKMESENPYLPIEEEGKELVVEARQFLNEDEIKEMENILSNENPEVISTIEPQAAPTLPEPPTIHSGNIEQIKDETPSLEMLQSENMTKDENVTWEDEAVARHQEKAIFKQETFVVVSRFYRVQKGDTYERIAEKYQVNVDQLKKMNQQKELKEGMLLKIIC